MHDAVESIRPEIDRSDRSDVHGVWIRRFGICLLVAVVILALFNVFGQRASTSTARSPVADLTVHAPTTVRAGLLFQGKITIVAHQDLAKASLVLGSGWIDGLTLNTNEPSAASETSGPSGALVLSLGALKAGQTFVQYFDYQVNPTSNSSRRQQMTLESGGTPVVSMTRTMTVFP
jgi:hypothetical protein